MNIFARNRISQKAQQNSIIFQYMGRRHNLDGLPTKGISIA